MSADIVHELLTQGYFPRELPPTFDTLEFGNRVLGAVGGMPDGFKARSIRARACQHNFARVGALRRRLSIPNPITQIRVSQLIGANWARLEGLITRSRLTQSRPVPGSARAFPVPSNDLTALRASNRATARYLLTADVSRFYHSIYTHSIPWAIHSKKTAKRNRKATLLGNALDEWVRNGQDGQTMGIPIGPDTSLIIAEVVLAAVDRRLVKKVPRVRGFRFMDDYELTFASRGNAEIALAQLQEAMAEYELALNPEKTAIEALPRPIEPSWKTELRDFRFRVGRRRQATDLLGYFDRAFVLSQQFPDKSVLAYAVKRLEGVRVRPENWSLLEDLLYQCLLTEAGTFAPIVSRIGTHHRRNGVVDREKLADVMNMQIAHHAPRGHGSEVAWALWTCLSWKLPIRSSATKALATMMDPVVALLSLHAREEGLFVRMLDVAAWRGHLTTDDLFGPQWLLAYEASVKGWLKGPGGRDHIAASDLFAWLRNIGVVFYQPDRLLPGQAVGGAPDEAVDELLEGINPLGISLYGAAEDAADSEVLGDPLSLADEGGLGWEEADSETDW